MADSNVENGNAIVTKDDEGTITFAGEVIATIAGLAAIDINGVAGMSGGLRSGVSELFGRKDLTKGIKVEVGKEEVAVDISIIVDYGVSIPEVAENIQNSVVKAIETMTGLNVVEVNISVQGIEVPNPEKDEAKAAKAKEKEEKSAPRVK